MVKLLAAVWAGEAQRSADDVRRLQGPDKTGPVEQMRVRLGPSQALNAPSLTLAASEYASLKRAGVELNTSRTRSVLLERCSCDAEAFGKQKNVSGINAMLADLAHNKVEMDSKLLNTVMGAYMRCGLPQLAIDVFHANVGDAPPAEADATASEAAAPRDAHASFRPGPPPGGA